MFKPTLEDFSAYERTRDDLLKSSYGRSVRLVGGLVGRIAAEIVPEQHVLDGPSLFRAEVVGRHGGLEFVDDAVQDEQLDIVSGVYFVSATDNDTESHLSWWPKHTTWVMHSGLEAGQWLPMAEEWYQTRLATLRAGRLDLVNSSQWKVKVKYQRPLTSKVLEGSERLAAEFLGKSTRVR
jgi:hypothetical protein